MLRHALIPLGANITEQEAQHALRRFDIDLPVKLSYPALR